MLQKIRDKSSSIIAQLIVGLIAVTFVVTGINFFSREPEQKIVAMVNDFSITEYDVLRAERAKRLQLLKIFGDDSFISDEVIKENAVAELVDEAVLLSFAESVGIKTPLRMVNSVVTKEIPQFQKEGKFDIDTFSNLISQQGMNSETFFDELTKDLTNFQITNGLSASNILLDEDIEKVMSLRNQTRTGQYMIISPADFEEDFAISSEMIKKYYDESKTSFFSEKTADVEYVVLTSNKYRDVDSISDSAIREAYNQEVKALEQKTERRVSHILLSGNDDGISEKVKIIQGLIKNNVSFSDLASSYSEDSVSSSKGGDLGFAPKGTYESEFEKALEDLKIGEISPPVKTSYGLHFIKLVDIKKLDIEPFEMRKDDLRLQLAESEALALLDSSIEEFANMAFSSDLEEVASYFGLEVKKESGITEGYGLGPFMSDSIRMRVFQDDLLNGEVNSDAFELGKDGWITFRVLDYKPPEKLSLDEVTAEISDILKTQMTASLVKNAAADLKSQLTSGVMTVNSDWLDFKDLSRKGNDSIDISLAKSIFDIPRGIKMPIVDYVQYNDSYITVVIDDINILEEAEYPRKEVSSLLMNERTSMIDHELRQLMREKAIIEYL